MINEEIVEYLKKRLRHARQSSLGLKFTMDDNLTKFGGWEIGYWSACVSTLENALDEIYGVKSLVVFFIQLLIIKIPFY